MATARLTLGALAIAAALAPLHAAQATDLVAITNRNEIIYFPADAPQHAVRWEMIGTQGMLVGIDSRPGDGKVYGITSSGALMLIDPSTGRASFKGIVSAPLTAAAGYLVDFNPVADRLRVIGAGGQNLRIDVDSGVAITDGSIRNAVGTGQAQVMGGAYTNSVRGARETRLYVFDSVAGRYALQNPPNDGMLNVVAVVPVVEGADIAFDGTRDVGYFVANNMLHVFDPATGAARAVGMIGPRNTVGQVIDIAVVRQ